MCRLEGLHGSLERLFTPAGWSRKYAIHPSANFERSRVTTRNAIDGHSLGTAKDVNIHSSFHPYTKIAQKKAHT